jgi:hypothetical protein
MLRLADNGANIYFCFDSPALRTPAARAVVNNPAGQARCMWGSSGMPWKEALSAIDRLHIPGTSALLRDNAAELFGLDRLPSRKAIPFVESEEAPMRIGAE